VDSIPSFGSDDVPISDASPKVPYARASFTQFVPGHVHLKDLGQLVAREIEASGGVVKEFNAIAVDVGMLHRAGGILKILVELDRG